MGFKITLTTLCGNLKCFNAINAINALKAAAVNALNGAASIVIPSKARNLKINFIYIKKLCIFATAMINNTLASDKMISITPPLWA